MCISWKVIAGLAAVGAGVWVLAPQFAGAAVPFLILAVCPLSMLIMMRGMGGGQHANHSTMAGQPALDGLSRDEQIALLKAQLAGAQAQQERSLTG
jgi:hypothetical protein